MQLCYLVNTRILHKIYINRRQFYNLSVGVLKICENYVDD